MDEKFTYTYSAPGKCDGKFTYTYSAPDNREVQEIRKKYLPKEENKLDTLRKLDKQIQNAGIVESLVIGIVGALIFGIGVCALLHVIGGGTITAAVLCTIGVIVMLPAYFIHRKIENHVRKQCVPQIMKLVEELEGNKN